MYYEPYKRRGARREERERRGGCLPRALWFFVKLIFKLAVLVALLAVVAYALPPGLFNVENALGAAAAACDSALKTERNRIAAAAPVPLFFALRFCAFQ